MPMNFGPLNQDGGERRLNVLITRARRRCVVYSNFNADDLDLRRTNARGVQALQTFLKYAATGILEVPRASGREADSLFEEAIASRLKARGHSVEHQIGSSGFFVDLAIVDRDRPGRYLLGIECDGATYHSARSARDRDRLRQQVLEGLGWTIHRIWSTDWFHHPEREMEKVEDAIRRAKLDDSFSEPAPERPRSHAAPISRVQVPEATQQVAGPYLLANPGVRLMGQEFHEVWSGHLMNWILQVVHVESPVHLQEVARRIATAAGVKRVGRRIRSRIQTAADQAVRDGKIYRMDNFLWRRDHKQVPLRRRDRLPPAMRKIDLISAQEIGTALIRSSRPRDKITP
jgi:very-short-patch-repair endonuclease